jgi:dimethylglycine dehydrogenase
MAEKESGPQKKLVTMSIETSDIDVSNDEAILCNGECVGYVTSGGYAHHIGRSMALGYIPVELVEEGQKLEVEINGTMYPAIVHLDPLYDPSGDKARG